MPDFRTTLPMMEFPFRITHQDDILCIGSCFAEHIGDKLEQFKFRSLLNPFGIVYNPVSVDAALRRLLAGNPFREEELFQSQGLWHSFAHHGTFSRPDKGTALSAMNESFEQARGRLAEADFLLITLGTAFVFEHAESGKVVANCHKLPGQMFRRRKLSVDEVTGSLLPVLEQIKALRPQLQLILTVSPVRHLRDGLIENQRAKAVLLLAVEACCRQLDFVHYFPSYELLLDDLRDYRFYDADMTHPSRQAIDYIWTYFRQAFFDEATQILMDRIEKVLTAAAHRPFHADTDHHRQFLQTQLQKIGELEKAFPFLDFEKEKAIFFPEV